MIGYSYTTLETNIKDLSTNLMLGLKSTLTPCGKYIGTQILPKIIISIQSPATEES